MTSISDIQKRHMRSKSSSSLPFLLSPHVSTGSLTSISPISSSNKEGPNVTPSIREEYFGQTLGMRSNFQEASGIDSSIGQPDLIHWGKYYGSRSSKYLNNDFGTEKIEHNDRKDDDGYIGFYHYANGVCFDFGELDIEEYICELLGIEKKNESYYLKKEVVNADIYSNLKREMVVTFCTYNIFNRSDFRARFVIRMNGSTKRVPVKIDKSYQIVPNQSNSDVRSRKTLSFNSHTIKDLSSGYWEELRASELVRLFVHLDNPSQQLTGLVSYPYFISSKSALIGSITLLIKFLPKGSIVGTKPTNGASTSSGQKSDNKTTYYRNYLVDALLRLCQLDISGEASDIAIKSIKERYYSSPEIPGDWDYIILKILKIHKGSNKEQEFINLIHDRLRSTIYCTQSALVLLEQVKFLITKESYQTALTIAQKCVEILPLDFDCWYYLTLCYILIEDFENALLVMNSIPVVLSYKQKNRDIDTISGVKDLYGSSFIYRLNSNDEPISEKTFNSYFPTPKIFASSYPSSKIKKLSSDVLVDEGSINKMWKELFLFNSHLRHPINGYQFYQSPLMNCSTQELASVDPKLINLCGPNSAKIILASQSSGSPSTSISDFSKNSTWGRCYDLLSFLAAIVGWDGLVRLKEEVFKKKEISNFKLPFVVNHDSKKDSFVVCETWLDQLFLIIYEDLRLIMVITSNNREQQHSAIEWEVLGLLGWSAKYNLEESISSLITSVMGTSVEGGFDYFGIVQLLEIYDEFILSEVTDSNIDFYHDDYDSKFLTNKLILKISGNYYNEFIISLEKDYLTLDFILLYLMKLISWNLRWYQYTPSYLIIKLLTKLCIRYDSIFIRGKIKVIFEQNKKGNGFKNKSKSSKFSVGSLLGSSSKGKEALNYEFTEGDTIIDYVERIIAWIENLKEPRA